MPASAMARQLLGAAIIACAVSAPAVAAYVGPAVSAHASVSAILQKPVDEQQVTLQGHLLRKTGHEKYRFSDGTGEILVEIDDKDFPATPIDASTKVRIRGEVDTGRHRPPEIEVDSLEIVK